MRDRIKHRITEPNEEQQTGLCSVCGIVKLYRIAPGKPWWRCAVALQSYSSNHYAKPETRSVLYSRRYGLSVEQYDRLVLKQDGKCARCLCSTERRLDVDHCHKTGKIRGLLCSACNLYIGRLESQLERLPDDLAYLSSEVNVDE